MGFRNPLTSLSASQITPGTLDPGVIAQALADGTVTAQALATAAVTGPKIATGAVLADAIGAGQVFAEKIAAGAITTAKLAAGVITTAKLALGAMQSNLVRNGSFEDTGEAVPTAGTKSTAIPGWSVVNVVGDSYVQWVFKVPGLTARSGSGCGEIVSTSAGGSSGYMGSDPFPVVAGTQYRFSVWAAPHQYSLGAGVSAGVWWKNAAGGIISYVSVAVAVLNTTAYVELAATLTAPAGATSVVFLLQCGGGAAAIRYYTMWDSASCIEIGYPAVEITPAGLRMWNHFGVETITLDGETATIGAGILIVGSGEKVYGDLDVTGNTTLAGGVHTYVVNSDTTLVAAAAPVTTSGANTCLSVGGEIQRVSSLRRYKLDREPIPAVYELLDVEPVTWHDAAVLAADPGATARVAGFVAENVADISTAAGGALDPLLVLDESGQLAGLSYDRFVAYLLPIIADIHHRVLRLETP